MRRRRESTLGEGLSERVALQFGRAVGRETAPATVIELDRLLNRTESVLRTKVLRPDER